MSSEISKIVTPNSSLGLIVAIASAIIFGLYPAAARGAYAEGANFSLVIIFTTWCRALSLILFCLITKKNLVPAPAQARAALLGGCFQALSIFGIIGALVYLTSAVVIVLMFTHTLMLLAYMAWRGELTLTPAVLVSTAVALLGITFVVDLWGALSQISVVGVGLALMAALATAIRLYVFGQEVKLFNPAVIGAQVFLVAAICSFVLCPFAWPELPKSTAGYQWLIACSLSLVLGTFGMFYGIALLGAFSWSLISKLEPIFTALLAFLLLGESLLITQYLGILLVTAALAFYQFYSGRVSRRNTPIAR